MSSSKKILLIFLLSLLAVFLIGVSIIVSVRKPITRVVFLDVGQGDAVLITRGTRQILIDGGADERRLLEHLSRFVPFWDRTIDVLIATHPDADHIGAQVSVLRRYRVPIVIAADWKQTSTLIERWRQALSSSETQVVRPDKGVSLELTAGDPAAGLLEILYPRTSEDVYESPDTNSAGVVARFKVGEASFLLTADLPSDREKLISTGKVDVLKVAHHGSRFSTADFFLEAVKPSLAVISVGRKNSYGHPAPEVLERLRRRDIEILRTDEEGTIIFECLSEGNSCVLKR